MTAIADVERMPLEVAALFTAMSEGMGLTHKHLVTMFGIAGKDPLRTVRRWCHGDRPIPAPIYRAIEGMYDRLDKEVDRIEKRVTTAQAAGETVTLTAYRNEHQLRVAEPEFDGLPASFHRAILLRVWESTGAPIVYAEGDFLDDDEA